MDREDAEAKLELAELCLRYMREMTARHREQWYKSLQEVARWQENVLKLRAALKQLP